MVQTKKERDFLFDNYKAFLIIMVVIGHFLQPCYKNNIVLNILKIFIYTFHMPAFVFVSGYFSKKNVSWKTAVQKMLIPYLSFQVIYYMYYTYGIGIDTKWTLEYPKFSLWYLLALFAWKLITPYFRKLPHFFLISLGMGVGFGCLELTGTYLSISRIVVFYPFFLAGMLFDRNSLAKWRAMKYRCLSVVSLGLLTFVSVVCVRFGEFRLSYFYGKASFESLGLSNLEGVLVRVICYGFGFAFTYLFAVLMTEKEIRISKLGRSTMSIYLFHGLLFKFMENKTTILESVNTAPEVVVLLMFCLGIAYVFSLTPFVNVANVFSSVSLEMVPIQNWVRCMKYSMCMTVPAFVFKIEEYS